MIRNQPNLHWPRHGNLGRTPFDGRDTRTVYRFENRDTRTNGVGAANTLGIASGHNASGSQVRPWHGARSDGGTRSSRRQIRRTTIERRIVAEKGKSREGKLHLRAASGKGEDERKNPQAGKPGTCLDICSAQPPRVYVRECWCVRGCVHDSFRASIGDRSAARSLIGKQLRPSVQRRPGASSESRIATPSSRICAE